MKKKWIVVVVILICCLVYAIVKLSMSENQYAYNQEKETPSAKQRDADNTGKATPGDAGSTDKATPEEGSGSAVPAAQVEAVTKVFSEFQTALKSKDYEQAWKLTSESLKSQGSFAEFKEAMTRYPQALIMEATMHPESATKIDGRVRVRITVPSGEDDHASFVQEDGQWKLD